MEPLEKVRDVTRAGEGTFSPSPMDEPLEENRERSDASSCFLLSMPGAGPPLERVSAPSATAIRSNLPLLDIGEVMADGELR